MSGADRRLRPLKCGGPVTALSMHPSRPLVAVGLADGACEMWEYGSGEENRHPKDAFSNLQVLVLRWQHTPLHLRRPCCCQNRLFLFESDPFQHLRQNRLLLFRSDTSEWRVCFGRVCWGRACACLFTRLCENSCVICSVKRAHPL